MLPSQDIDTIWFPPPPPPNPPFWDDSSTSVMLQSITNVVCVTLCFISIRGLHWLKIKIQKGLQKKKVGKTRWGARGGGGGVGGGGGGLYMVVCFSLEDPGNAHVSSPVFHSSFPFLLSVVVVVSSSSSFLHSVPSQNWVRNNHSQFGPAFILCCC